MPIELVLGDITHVDADAIVNAANRYLAPGGGVCGAIHRAAGPKLALACAKWVAEHGPVETGSAAITPGFGLSAKYVIHAVGPVWHGGDSREAELLGSAYAAAMQRADEAGLESIAFPSISTGIFGYPLVLAAPVAASAVARALGCATHVRVARFVLFDRTTYRAYEDAVAAL